MILATWDRQARDAAWYVWARLPWHIKEALDGRVTIKAIPGGDGHVADAGRDDILLRLPLPQWKAHQVVAHELGHIYARHYDRVVRGEISEAQAEAEANRLAAAWGFGR